MYRSPNIFRVIKIEKEDIDGACSTYGWEEKCMQGYGGETWDSGIDYNIKMDI
jgi:hypothetical protein